MYEPARSRATPTSLISPTIAIVGISSGNIDQQITHREPGLDFHLDPKDGATLDLDGYARNLLAIMGPGLLEVHHS